MLEVLDAEDLAILAAAKPVNGPADAAMGKVSKLMRAVTEARPANGKRR